MTFEHFFSHLAHSVARHTGRPGTFAIAIGFLLLWAISGFIFNYSVSWQLFVDTACTIVTFLMVLLIQNTQNRDTQAIQMKLDELIHTSKQASNELIEVEKLTEKEIEEVREMQREVREEKAS